MSLIQKCGPLLPLSMLQNAHFKLKKTVSPRFEVSPKSSQKKLDLN